MATYTELQVQIAQLQKQAEEVRKQEIASVIADINAMMAQYGLTIEDLGSTRKTSKKTGSAVAAKYRDPVSGATWSGRGIQPKWMKSALAEGKNKDDFLIA